MIRLILAAALALSLAACNTAGLNAGLGQLNATIVSADQTVKALCPSLRGIVAASRFFTDQRQSAAFAQAEAALAVACDVQARDIGSAAVAVASAIAAARAAGLAGTK